MSHWKKNHVLAFLAFSALILSFGFQNCSKVGVQDISSSQKSTGGPTGLGSDDELMDGGTGRVEDEDEDAGPVEDPIMVGNPGMPTDPSLPPVPMNPTDEPLIADENDSRSETELVAICLGSKSKGALTGSEITNIRGNTVIESDLLTLIKDIRGNSVIRGKTDQASAKLIRDIRGNTLICGLSIDDMENIRGNVTLVNSTVQSLRNMRGNIRLVNSEIQNTSDVRGNIR